jgi:transcriptional regulator with XRE-family HTH domain
VSSSSRLTPAKVFGQRVREMRELRGYTQTELARRMHLERTTLNKIERGSRSDVSISQLFAFAEALEVAPIRLLTPRVAGERVEMTPGGRVLPAVEARLWIRGVPPALETPEEMTAWILTLPQDEQVELLTRAAMTQQRPRYRWGSLAALLVGEPDPKQIESMVHKMVANLDDELDDARAATRRRRRRAKEGDDDGK